MNTELPLSEQHDALEIPAFLRRAKQQENIPMAKEPKTQPDEEVNEVAADKEARPTKAQFLEAANEIDEIDAEIEKVHASVAAQIEALNGKRNAASEVVRKYLGRKR